MTSLNKRKYEYEVTNLIQCTSQFELDNSFQLFSEKFDEIVNENPNKLKILYNELSNIGLQIINKKIIYENHARWDEVSQLSKIKYRMPTATNSLESYHGHLNHKTPRRNTFYTSIFKINQFLTMKYTNIKKRISHNYNDLKNKTIKNIKN